MNIILAGKDRTADIGTQIVEEAARLKAACAIGSLSPEHTALRLKGCTCRDDFMHDYIDLLIMRHGVRTTDYYIPRGPGLRGKVAATLKTILWKLFRYQHDRIAFQQNLINEMSIRAQTFQRNRLERELIVLRQRIADLEQGRSKSTGS